MDDIVEKFLLEKLDEEIKGAREVAEQWGSKSRCSKLVSIHKECQELKDLMEKKNQGTGAAVKETRREKLYYLFNLIAEWREVLKKQPRSLLSLDEILRKLKQVKKELEEPSKKQVKIQVEEEASGKEVKTEVEEEEEAASKKQVKTEPAWADPQVYPWSSHAAALAKIHGFGDKLMIMERLLCSNAKAVGIVGVAGVGKTALCQKAYNHPPVRDHFPLRIWLCLSKHQKPGQLSFQDQLNFEDQLKRMLSSLGFEDQVIEKVGVEKLELALRRQLNRGRYLVVLDDVWVVKEKDKEEKENGRVKEKENGRVVVEKGIRNLFSFLTPHQGTLLLTSRSPELEKMVGPNNMHRLLPLADDHESWWKIFTDAFKEEDQREELEKLKPSILENCDGLPLMAKMLGQIGHQPQTQN